MKKLLGLQKRHWKFIFLILLVPLTLNTTSMLWHEIMYKTISDFHNPYQAFGVPYYLWLSFFQEIAFVEIVLAIIGWATLVFLESNFLQNLFRSLRAILIILATFFSALVFGIGALSIDIIWASTFRSGPSLGLPSSSTIQIVTISSFLIVTFLYTSRYRKNIPNLQSSIRRAEPVEAFNLGLIGYPISASVSPKIHSAALKETGLDGEYKLYPIHPDDEQGLKDLLKKVRAGEIHGLNVTIPHKQNVIPLVDELSATAKTIGAVNTIVLKDGKLIGDNTDAPGFWNDLQKLLKNRENPQKPRSVILGAGGAARAVTYALINAGWDVTLATRAADIPQAKALIADFTTQKPKYAEKLSNTELNATSLSPLLSFLSLIVNATPVGMKSHYAGTPWLKNLPFPENALLYDLIYTPAQTQLIQDAAQAGLPTRNGLGMLIEQALLSFEIWTGKKIPADKIILKSDK
jgi:shikimate dehydrogenase